MIANLIILVNILLLNLTSAKYFAYSRGLGPSCTWDCAKACAVCESREYLDNGDFKVTINLASCKNDKVSWACCKNTPGCVINSCDGTISGNKCDDLTKITFTLPAGTTTLNLQVHDGKLIGNVDCSSNGCCGGSGTSCEGATSGVCNYQIDLSTCPCIECTKDEDCGASNYATCTKRICTNEKKCASAPLPSGTVCRSSTSLCENDSACNGNSMTCPAPTYRAAGTVCKSATTACENDGTCNGVDATCSASTFKASGTVCRVATSTCENNGLCNGVDNKCSDPSFKAAGTVCRASAGLCDKQEECTGVDGNCPSDGYQSAEYVCEREKGLCGPLKKCTGSSATC